jgi:hypothetical protein
LPLPHKRKERQNGERKRQSEPRRKYRERAIENKEGKYTGEVRKKERRLLTKCANVFCV